MLNLDVSFFVFERAEMLPFPADTTLALPDTEAERRIISHGAPGRLPQM